MWRHLYPEFDGKTLAPKFSIGDHVRITKKTKTFDKVYSQSSTEEVFKKKFQKFNVPFQWHIT